MQIINIPLEIPEQLIAAGAIELYATKMAGWTPKITETFDNGDGDFGIREIDNPETAMEACIRQIRGVVKHNYQTIILEQAQTQAVEKSLEDFNKLFTPDNE